MPVSVGTARASSRTTSGCRHVDRVSVSSPNATSANGPHESTSTVRAGSRTRPTSRRDETAPGRRPGPRAAPASRRAARRRRRPAAWSGGTRSTASRSSRHRSRPVGSRPNVARNRSSFTSRRALDLGGALGELLQHLPVDAGHLGDPVDRRLPADTEAAGQLAPQPGVVQRRQDRLVGHQRAGVQRQPTPIRRRHLRGDHRVGVELGVQLPGHVLAEHTYRDPLRVDRHHLPLAPGTGSARGAPRSRARRPPRRRARRGPPPRVAGSATAARTDTLFGAENVTS